MTFTEWLVERGYTSSEDKETIQSELSAVEADELYELYLSEGYSE